MFQLIGNNIAEEKWQNMFLVMFKTVLSLKGLSAREAWPGSDKDSQMISRFRLGSVTSIDMMLSASFSGSVD